MQITDFIVGFGVLKISETEMWVKASTSYVVLRCRCIVIRSLSTP